MIKIKFLALLFSFFTYAILADGLFDGSKSYVFSKDSIDVVIPCMEKDLKTLEKCIDGVKQHGIDVRNIYVISEKKLTDDAIWVNETIFPFSLEDVALEILQDKTKAKAWVNSEDKNYLEWIFQKLLKFYAPYVIEDISPNVLVLDAEVIFFKTIYFRHHHTLAAYFNCADEHNILHFEHAMRLIPGFKKAIPRLSGITHHMLFQKPVLDDLFFLVETNHKKPFWKALCSEVDKEHYLGSCVSEYEIYFNFALLRSKQFCVRELKWKNVDNLDDIKTYRKNNFDYVACHSFPRQNQRVK